MLLPPGRTMLRVLDQRCHWLPGQVVLGDGRVFDQQVPVAMSG